MTEDKIKLIALTAANSVNDKVDEKLEKVHSRITDIATEVSAIKSRISTLPTHPAIDEKFARCRAEQAKKSGITTTGWLKIVGMVLTLVAAALGIDFVANP